MLEQIFKKTLHQYSSNTVLVNQLFDEVQVMYSGAGRHYHNLNHLHHLLNELSACKPLIKKWNDSLLSMFYHDIIYDPSKNNNEEESGALAVKRLTEAKVKPRQINRIELQILATKKHTPTNDLDTDLFTDADVAILGASPDVYKNYTEQIRKEYKAYADDLYKAGRKKVLLGFLNRDSIFTTKYFFHKYEKEARINLMEELKTL